MIGGERRETVRSEQSGPSIRKGTFDVPHMRLGLFDRGARPG